MYKRDQKAIGEFAKSSPEAIHEVVKFVLVSIRRRFDLVRPIMAGECDVKFMDITTKGIEHSWRNRQVIFDTIHSDAPDAAKLAFLTTVPGLGIAKAGFVLQLCLGTVGCMDTHNLKMYGLSPKAFATPPSQKALVEKCKAYIAVCDAAGGSEALWDTWCEFIAAKYPSIWTDADHVSRDHVDSILRLVK